VKHIHRLLQLIWSRSDAKPVTRPDERNLDIETLRETIRTREHRLLAFTIHDGPLQLLLRTLLDLDRAIENGANPDTKDSLHVAREHLADAISEFNSLIADTRKQTIESAEMPQMLRYLISRSGSFFPTVAFTVQLAHPWPALNGETNYHIFSIIREALNNAGRHSDATDCILLTRYTGESYVIEIIDNGKGLDLSQGSIGISGMKERARIAQAQIRWISMDEARGGTKVSLTAPVSSDSASDQPVTERLLHSSYQS